MIVCGYYSYVYVLSLHGFSQYSEKLQPSSPNYGSAIPRWYFTILCIYSTYLASPTFDEAHFYQQQRDTG